jgi:hypothetical protein
MLELGANYRCLSTKDNQCPCPCPCQSFRSHLEPYDALCPIPDLGADDLRVALILELVVEALPSTLIRVRNGHLRTHTGAPAGSTNPSKHWAQGTSAAAPRSHARYEQAPGLHARHPQLNPNKCCAATLCCSTTLLCTVLAHTHLVLVWQPLESVQQQRDA